jgi:hypothetical protein
MCLIFFGFWTNSNGSGAVWFYLLGNDVMSKQLVKKLKWKIYLENCILNILNEIFNVILNIFKSFWEKKIFKL